MKREANAFIGGGDFSENVETLSKIATRMNCLMANDLVWKVLFMEGVLLYGHDTE